MCHIAAKVARTTDLIGRQGADRVRHHRLSIQYVKSGLGGRARGDAADFHRRAGGRATARAVYAGLPGQ